MAANARTITVARMNLNTTELNFKNQVIGLVSQVLNLYYNLAADYEDLRAKRSASETAQTFVNDVKRQIEIGSVAPTDLITAESQAASSAQAVVDSDATVAAAGTFAEESDQPYWRGRSRAGERSHCAHRFHCDSAHRQSSSHGPDGPPGAYQSPRSWRPSWPAKRPTR